MVPLLSGALMATMFNWPGTPQDRESESDVLAVGPNFFSTMQIPFNAGRGFTASDYEIAASAASRSAPPAVPTPVIVDQAFVAKFLGKENPLGKRFGQSAASQDGPASPGYEIIGVVRDTKYSDLRRETSPMMYVPQTMQGASFEVRTASDASFGSCDSAHGGADQPEPAAPRRNHGIAADRPAAVSGKACGATIRTFWFAGTCAGVHRVVWTAGV